MIAYTDLTNCQKNATYEIIKWRRINIKPFFTVGGWAGTGKSTIIPFAASELNIHKHNIRYVSFTGKAALILIQKGIPATTIHSLIYEPQQDHYGNVHFVKKRRLDPSIKLIIVDEYSMISNTIMKDLLSFKIPILLFGDPGQLPPVGETNRYITKPDYLLDKIHRQAEDNEIIAASAKIRMGETLPFTNGKNLRVLHMNEFNNDRAFWADQILCGTNATRNTINKNMRCILGRTNASPVVGDKIICLRNNRNECIDSIYYLVNGMTGFITQLDNTYGSTLSFQPDFLNNMYHNLQYDPNIFLNQPASDDNWKNNINEFDYAYAITVHKAQGSQYKKVAVCEEVLRRETHQRWLYTAATRAECELEIFRAS